MASDRHRNTEPVWGGQWGGRAALKLCEPPGSATSLQEKPPSFLGGGSHSDSLQQREAQMSSCPGPLLYLTCQAGAGMKGECAARV